MTYDSCAQCNKMLEAISHLLVGCYFVMPRLGSCNANQWSNGLCGLVDMWVRKLCAKDDRKCFDTLVILVSWLFWKKCDRRTFDHRARSLQELISLVEDEIVAWFRAGFKQLQGLVLAFGRALDAVSPLRSETFVGCCTKMILLLIKNMLSHEICLDVILLEFF